MQTEAPFQYCSAGTRRGKQHLLSLSAGLCFYQLAQSLKFCRNRGFRCASLCPSGGAHGPARPGRTKRTNSGHGAAHLPCRAGPAQPRAEVFQGNESAKCLFIAAGRLEGAAGARPADTYSASRRAPMYAGLRASRPSYTQGSASSPRSVPVPPPHCPGTLPGRRRGDTPGRERSRTAARAGLGWAPRSRWGRSAPPSPPLLPGCSARAGAAPGDGASVGNFPQVGAALEELLIALTSRAPCRAEPIRPAEPCPSPAARARRAPAPPPRPDWAVRLHITASRRGD